MANMRPRVTPPASAVRDVLDKIKKAAATLAEALTEPAERFSPEWEEWQAVTRHLHVAASAWRPSEQQRVSNYLERAIELAAKMLPAEFDAPLGPGNPKRFLHRLDEVRERDRPCRRRRAGQRLHGDEAC